MWIEPKGFDDVHARGNTEAHRLQDPSKWVPFGVGAIQGSSSRPLAVLDSGTASDAGTNASGNGYGPGEEPRPRDGEPTAAAHGEML